MYPVETLQLLQMTKSSKSKKGPAASKQAGKTGQKKVMAPVSSGRSGPVLSRQAAIKSRADGTISVTHREYIADVVAGAAGSFTNTQLHINPGLFAMFIWLSVIANRFEGYVFRKLKFCFESACSTNRSGTVMLAVDFDSADQAPTTKAQMLAFQGAVRSNVWDECSYTCTPANLTKFKQYFVRAALPAANLDIKTYDVGCLNIATAGTSVDALQCGELYVEYTVDLFTPQLTSAPDPQLFQAAFTQASGPAIPSATPWLRAIKTGLLPVEKAADGSGLIANRVGQYLIEHMVQGNENTNDNDPDGDVLIAADDVNSSIFPVDNTGNSGYVEQPTAGGTFNTTRQFRWQVDAVPAKIKVPDLFATIIDGGAQLQKINTFISAFSGVTPVSLNI